MSRQRTKYILVLVEGYTDEEILAPHISQLFEQKYGENVEVRFCKMRQEAKKEFYTEGGDITSSYGVNQDNIEGIINKSFIDPFLDKNPGIYARDIEQVIQIVDIDGAFVKEEEIEYSDSCENTMYLEDKILTNKVDKIIERNNIKCLNLKKLVSMNKIGIRENNGRNVKTRDYSVYYFSCNMDHYIHNKMNLSQKEKVDLADEYNANKSDQLDEFIDLICDDETSCKGMSYEDSWAFIMTEGSNSLKRKTNLNILIDNIKN